MYKHRLTILICTLIIVGLVCAPFSPPARAIVGVDDALAGGLFMAFFEAMGLSFTFTGIDQTKEGLLEFIQDQYDLYCIHKGVVATLISDAWSSLSEAIFSGGTIKLPREAAEDMSDFAEWMSEEYDLTDNDSAVVSSFSGIMATDGTVFQNGGWYPADHVYEFSNGNRFSVEHDGSNTKIIVRVIYNNNLVTKTGTRSSGFSGWGYPLDLQPSGDKIRIGNSLGSNSGFQLPAYNNQYLTLEVVAGLTVQSTEINSDVINLPGEIPEDDDIYVSVPGITDVFGGTIEGAADQMLEAALDDDLEASYEITDEPPVYPTPEGPTILNVFTDQLGSFFNTIWHYVSDLVDYASPFIIVWRDQLMGVFPFRLMLPLYASFVLALFLGLYKVFRGVH